MPILFKSRRLAKLLEHPVLPGHREHARCSARSALVGYFPAKFRLRVLPPVHFDVAPGPGALLAQPGDGRVGTHPRHRPGRALRHAAHAAAACGSGSDRDARPRHRARHLLGRPRRAASSSSGPTSRSIVGRRHRATRASRSSAPSSCAPTRSYSILARIVRATQVDTILHTHLIVDSTARQRPHAARDQRDRHDEPARGRGRGRAARCARSCSRARASSTAPTTRTRTSSAKTMTRTQRAAHQRRAFAARSRGVPARLRRRQPARRPSRCCASPTCSATTSTRRSRTRCAARSCPRSSASIRACSSCTRTTSSARSMYATTNDVPGVYNVAGDGNMPWSEVCAIVGKRARRAAAVAHQPRRPSRCGCCGSGTCRPRRCSCCATAARSTTARYKRAGFRYQYTTAGTVEAFARGLRLAGTIGDKQPDVPLRARRRRLLPPLARRGPRHDD